MPQSTDLNISPFYDDFDPTNQFYRVLFRPSVPVQARELTQLQSILQNQIEEFGLNILEQGTVVRGCTFTYIKAYPFVKIKDLEVDGSPVNISEYSNGIVREVTTGLTAKVFNYSEGLESQAPNLNTLYVRYTNAGNTGTTIFANNSILEVFTHNYAIQELGITSGGTGYSNNDTLVFTSSVGTGASGTLQTNSSGGITSLTLTAAGNNYTSNPTLTVANTTGGTANGSGASLYANAVLARITTSPNTVATSNVETWPTGTGYGFKVSDGVIFQKGFFIYVDPQEIIVDPYKTTPSNLIVGFNVVETIVNNSVDSSLNDNAAGTRNEGAPGAYRLKLEPTLELKSVANVDSSNNFFTLVEFQEGVAVRQRQETQYSTLGKELARRTYDESGDYVVKPFKVLVDEYAGNSTHFMTYVTSGVGYINGFRVEQFGKVPLAIRKGTDIRAKLDQTISPSYGSYVIVDQFVGNFPFNTAAGVSLRNAAATQMDDSAYTAGSAPGSEIGTAKIRCVTWHQGLPGSGDGQYRIYLFDIAMAAGKNFADVRCIFYDGATKGAGDVVLDAYGKCALTEPERGALIFPFGKNAVKTLRDLSNTNDTSFVYRTHNPSATVNSSGMMTLTASGTETFPYTAGANLSVDERNELVVMLTASANGATLTGTVTTSANTVVGSGTAFLTELAVNDHIIANAEVRRITLISNNTHAQTETLWGAANGAGITAKRHYPAYRAVPLTHPILTRYANVDSNANNLTVVLGESLSGSAAAVVGYNVQRNDAVQLTKTLYPEMIVKLHMSSTARAALNSWCLGVPDALKLISVTKGTNSDYTTGQTDVTSSFEIVNGQADSHYGLSYLRKKVNASVTVSNGDYMVVTFDVLRSANTGGGAGFYSIDSYPIDDTTTSGAADKIRTEEIPAYYSPVTGVQYELRDCVDFRPQASNTAAYANTLGSATENPANTVTISTTEAFFPNPSDPMIIDYQYYVGRSDKIFMNSLGQLSVVEGAPSEEPTPPNDQAGSLTIASISVPPFPSLSPSRAYGANKQSMSVTTKQSQVERLTMKDLNELVQRIENLEYYTSLSLLETQTKDLVIPSELDGTLNRFKHGIFVDPFTNLINANTASPEYRAGHDPSATQLVPAFEIKKIDLELVSNTNLNQTGDVISSSYTEAEILGQPYATKRRKCSDDFWTFTGTVDLIPGYDNFIDTTTPPVPTGGGINVSGAWNAWNYTYPLYHLF